MLASKSKSVWCWVTELKLKQRLFFPIEVGGAMTRGSDTNMLNKICPNKISQTLSWRADAPPSILSFYRFLSLSSAASSTAVCRENGVKSKKQLLMLCSSCNSFRRPPCSLFSDAAPQPLRVCANISISFTTRSTAMFSY